MTELVWPDMSHLDKVLGLVASLHTTGAYEKRELPDLTTDFICTPQLLAQGVQALRDFGRVPLAVVFTPLDYSAVRMFSRDIIVLEARKDFLLKGLLSSYEKTLLLVSKTQPKGEVLFLGEFHGESGARLASPRACFVLKLHQAPPAAQVIDFEWFRQVTEDTTGSGLRDKDGSLATIVLNPKDFIAWTKVPQAYRDLEPETHRELLGIGVRGYCYGHPIKVSVDIPEGYLQIVNGARIQIGADPRQPSFWESR